MEVTEQIRKMTEGLLADESHFVVDVILSANKGPKKLVVVLDGDNGISIDDCADVSRKLSELLDETNLVDDRYLLEVSTPGLDQPLKLIRQFRKNVGRNLKVKTKELKTIEGKLETVSDEKIILETTAGSGKKKELKTLEIPFTSIDKAFVLVSFK